MRTVTEGNTVYSHIPGAKPSLPRSVNEMKTATIRPLLSDILKFKPITGPSPLINQTKNTIHTAIEPFEWSTQCCTVN